MEDDKRRPNTNLQHERLCRGWSQKKVGVAIGTSKEMVSRWETGERAPSPYYREQLCNLFGLSAEDLGFIEPPQAEKTALIGLPQEMPLVYNNTFQNIMTAMPGIKGDILGISRRQALHGILDSACTALVLAPYAMLNTDAIDRLAAVVVQYFTIDNEVLNDLSAVTQRYWKLSVNLSLEVLSGITGHLQTIIHLLKRPQPTSVSKHLYSIASEAAQIIGKILFDTHEHKLSWAYYSFALNAAKESQNQILYAAGLGRMSLLAMSNDQPGEALSLLEHAHNLTIQNYRIRAWLLIVEAEAYARADDINSFNRAMENSECIAHDFSLEEDMYFTGFNFSRIAGYKGSCYLRLNKVELALDALQEAYTLLDPFYVRRKSGILAHMGTGHAKMGNIRGAYDYASQALTIIAQTGSLDTLNRIYVLRKEIYANGGGGSTLIKDLDQQIRGVQQRITSVQN